MLHLGVPSQAEQDAKLHSGLEPVDLLKKAHRDHVLMWTGAHVHTVSAESGGTP